MARAHNKAAAYANVRRQQARIAKAAKEKPRAVRPSRGKKTSDDDLMKEVLRDEN